MSLPLLPGMSFSNPARTDFRKSQAFGFRNGIPVHDGDKPGIGGAASPGGTKRGKLGSSAAMTLQAQTGEYVPPWVAFDRQVLRFYGYYLESVVESRNESYRIHKCNLLYYLEDDTMHLVEPKVENSGLPQGTIVKRHRFLRDGSDGMEEAGYYTVQDLNVGIELAVYGRVLRLVDCDEFTKNFMAKLGIALNPSEPLPEDPFVTKPGMSKTRAPDVGIVAARMEKLKLRQFLQNDRQVLRFFARWDDRTSMFGDVRRFEILYFLADDTVGVNEINPANSGRDPFPQFVRRQKLPRTLEGGLSTAGGIVPPMMTARDFVVGRNVNIFGRDVLIYDCDPFTRNFCATKLGVAQPEGLEISEPEPEPPKRDIPPPTGFGTEEDSLGSVVALVPKAPKKDFQKMMVQDGKVLRFSVRLVTDRPEDADRRFTLSYFLADDSLLIFEPPQRNSGLPGGKFLERGVVTNDAAGRPFLATDLYVGAEITVYRRKFMLCDADEYCFKYMEEHCDVFPQSNIAAILSRKIVPAIKTGHLAAKIRTLARQSGVPLEQLREVLFDESLQLTPQEIVTVVRRYAQPDGTADVATLALDLRV